MYFDLLNSSVVGLIACRKETSYLNERAQLWINEACGTSFSSLADSEKLLCCIEQWLRCVDEVSSDPSRKGLSASIRHYFSMTGDHAKSINDAYNSPSAIVSRQQCKRSAEASRWLQGVISFESYEGEPLCVISLQDISDNKRLELTAEYKDVLLDTVLTMATEAVVVLGADRTIEYFSPRAEQLFNVSSVEIMMDDLESLFDTRSSQIISDYLYKTNRKGWRNKGFERLTAHRQGGGVFPTRVVLGAIEQSGQAFLVLLIRDQTSFLAFIDSLNDAYLRFSKAGNLMAHNQYAAEMLGLERMKAPLKFEDLALTSMTQNVSNSEPFRLPSDLPELVESHVDRLKGRLLLSSKLGKTVPVSVSVWPENDDGEIIYNLVLRDETESIEHEKKLTHTAYHDGLTELPNRHQFSEALKSAIKKHGELGAEFALLFIDLDRFKVVNDSLGHALGDRLLVAVTERLKRNLRQGDFIARIGGDEFVAILANINSLEIVLNVAERMRLSIEKVFDIEGRVIKVSASIGVACYPENADNAQQLLHSADLAMYAVKNCGRNGIRVFTPNLKADLERRIRIESCIRQAIDNSEFSVVYQPKVSLLQNRVVGFEALIRWRQNDDWISPAEFIPIAEEIGIICDIDCWVMQRVAEDMKAWQKSYPEVMGPIRTSLNISTLHLHKRLKDDITNLILQKKIDPSRLEIEITESAEISNVDESFDALCFVHDQGIRISVDDFGTGYCSLQYLMDMPIDIVKIDRSFVTDVNEKVRPQHLVSAMVALADNMGFGLVAEGVETAEELSKLRAMGVDVIQGYYFSKPLPMDQAIEFARVNYGKIDRDYIEKKAQ